MGHHVIKMPDIGEGIAEVELITWKVEVGGPVAEDQVVAEVMTDKAMVEIPSPVSGTVVSLGGTPGQMMAVGSELIRLEVEGAGNASAASAPAAAAAAEPVAAPKAAAPAAAPATAAEAAPAATPAKAAAASAPACAAKQDARGAVTNGVLNAGEAPLASPAVRRRAWDLGIELRYVPATGPGGRILQADLDAYAAAGGKAQPVGGSAGGSSYARRTGEQQVPIIGLRRKIAQKMQQSWTTIPHITYVEEIDVTEVEALR
ncbi:MAG: biotin/lipoyl-containing protein, partial [Stenotrophomonas sp.]